jgi:hypothetical protein
VEAFWKLVSDRISLADRTSPVAPPDKSGGSSLETGESSLEAGHGPDKSGGGTGLVQYPSLESGPDPLEAGGFTGQVR